MTTGFDIVADLRAQAATIRENVKRSGVTAVDLEVIKRRLHQESPAFWAWHALRLAQDWDRLADKYEDEAREDDTPRPPRRGPRGV